jgi:hypothetical protein
MDIVTRLRVGQFGVGNVFFSIASCSLLFHGFRDPFYFFRILFMDDYEVSGLLIKGYFAIILSACRPKQDANVHQLRYGRWLLMPKELKF